MRVWKILVITIALLAGAFGLGRISGSSRCKALYLEARVECLKSGHSIAECNQLKLEP